MGAIRAVLLFVGGFGLVVSAALSFAPATDRERAALGPDPGRVEVLQRRLAIGLRDLAPASVQRAFASATGLSDDQVLTALDRIIDPPGAATDRPPTLPAPPEVQVRSIRAGGALFVSAP